jgi:hypothetical protein
LALKILSRSALFLQRSNDQQSSEDECVHGKRPVESANARVPYCVLRKQIQRGIRLCFTELEALWFEAKAPTGGKSPVDNRSRHDVHFDENAALLFEHLQYPMREIDVVRAEGRQPVHVEPKQLV